MKNGLLSQVALDLLVVLIFSGVAVFLRAEDNEVTIVTAFALVAYGCLLITSGWFGLRTFVRVAVPRFAEGRSAAVIGPAMAALGWAMLLR